MARILCPPHVQGRLPGQSLDQKIDEYTNLWRQITRRGMQQPRTAMVRSNKTPFRQYANNQPLVQSLTRREIRQATNPDILLICLSTARRCSPRICVGIAVFIWERHLPMRGGNSNRAPGRSPLECVGAMRPITPGYGWMRCCRISGLVACRISRRVRLWTKRRQYH